MNVEIITSLVRHLLTLAGGYFVSKGIVDHASSEAIIGGVVAAVGVAWSIVHNLKKS
jgi:hypothetical protein